MLEKCIINNKKQTGLQYHVLCLLGFLDYFRLAVAGGFLGYRFGLRHELLPLPVALRFGAVGGGAFDIPGAAITALTQAGTDADKQAVINFNTDLLAGSTLYTHFRLAMTTAVADCDAGAVVLGFDPRYAPASDNDASTVDEIVTV